MRVTPSIISRNYNRNINRNLNKMNDIYNACITGRKFSKASEDPTSYIKESFFKKQEAKVTNYLSNINTVKSKFECAEGNMHEINNILKDAQVNITNALTGTLNDGNRKILAGQLRDMQDNILKTANFQFTGNYIFGGSTTKTPPLEYNPTTNIVMYKGVDVSDPANFAQLETLSNEDIYVDIGFIGADGSVSSENALNISLSALNLLGFGNEVVNTETVDKNVIVLLGDIADILEKDNFNSDDIRPYYDVFQKQQSSLLNSIADIGSKTKLLENTNERLLDLEIAVTDSVAKTSATDHSSALVEYKMQELLYNVSMQLGANVIPNTLFNFIK